MAKEIWNSWPQWLVNAIIAAYQEGKTAEEISAVLGRQCGVVRSKLVREGVYLSKTTKRKQIKETVDEGF